MWPGGKFLQWSESAKLGNEFHVGEASKGEEFACFYIRDDAQLGDTGKTIEAKTKRRYRVEGMYLIHYHSYSLSSAEANAGESSLH